MNNRIFFIILLLSLVGLSFFVGYYFGAANTLNKLGTTDFVSAKSSHENSSLHINSKQTLGNNEQKLNQTSASTEQNNRVPTVSSETNIDDIDEQQSAFEQLIQNGSVEELLNHLLMVSKSEDKKDMEQFGPTIDALQSAIEKDPDELQVLIDFYIDADTESKAHYYITSVLLGIDSEESNQSLTYLINRLTAIGTHQANEKLLHLVASTGSYQDKPEIINTIKNIALYGQDNQQNRLYALDLLMPFQLSKDEKNKVISDFTLSLNQASGENKSYYIENIIRFSDQIDRPRLANEYLKTDHDFETRVAILSSLHSRSVMPNEQLKNTLFSIAQNSNDPLHTHAKHALMYVFEINNDEYNRLLPTSP